MTPHDTSKPLRSFHWHAPDRASWHCFLLILAGYVFIRVVFYQGIIPSDPLGYIEYARQMVEGGFKLEYHHYNTRFAITIPVAASFALFGIHEASTVLWPLLCSITSLYILFRMGAALFGSRAALLACGLLTALPLDIALSLQILPEPVLTAMLSISVWCFMKGYGENDSVRSSLWLFVAGLAVWGAYSAKILGILMAPILLTYVLIERLPIGRMVWLLAGLFALLIPEYGFYYLKAGDLLFPFHAVDTVHNMQAILVGQDFVTRIVKTYPSMTMLPSIHFGITFLCVYAAVAYGLSDWRRTGLLLLWFGALFVFNVVGSTSVSRYVFLPAEARYLHPVMIPGLLLVGKGLSDIRDPLAHGRLKRMTVAASLSTGVYVVIIGVSLIFAGFGLRRSAHEMSAIEVGKLGDVLRDMQPGILYADKRDVTLLQVLTSGRTLRLQEFPEPGDAESTCHYLKRFQPAAWLLYNWRLILGSKSSVLSPEQREILRRAYEEGALKPVWKHWEKPGPWFYRLADVGVFKRVLGEQHRLEFLQGREDLRGTVVFTVNPDTCRHI
ncbi:ArnT family glycosyltransferase [Candidatus Nitrospira bockiana]